MIELWSPITFPNVFPDLKKLGIVHAMRSRVHFSLVKDSQMHKAMNANNHKHCCHTEAASRGLCHSYLFEWESASWLQLKDCHMHKATNETQPPQTSNCATFSIQIFKLRERVKKGKGTNTHWPLILPPKNASFLRSGIVILVKIPWQPAIEYTICHRYCS